MRNPRLARALSLVMSVSMVAVLLPSSALSAQTGVTCDGLRATIIGTSGDDVLLGTENADVIAGLQGNDQIRGCLLYTSDAADE